LRYVAQASSLLQGRASGFVGMKMMMMMMMMMMMKRRRSVVTVARG
jgi:hypothetical protein